MSDTAAESTPVPDAKKSGGVLRIILVVLLLVMLGLLGLNIYTGFATAAAFEKVEEQVMQNVKATPAEIHQLIGREPDGPIEKKEHWFEERYSWRRGNLVTKEFIIVLYADTDGEPLLHEVVRNDEPTANDIPNAPPPELTPEELERLNNEPVEGASPPTDDVDDQEQPTED